LLHFNFQSPLVDNLLESIAQSFMNIHSTAYNFMSNRFVQHNPENPLIGGIGVQTEYVQFEVCVASQPFVYFHKKSPFEVVYILRRRKREKKFRNTYFANKSLHFCAFSIQNPLHSGANPPTPCPQWLGVVNKRGGDNTMRTQHNKGQANPASTKYRQVWLALFTATLALAITFTLSCSVGDDPGGGGTSSSSGGGDGSSSGGGSTSSSSDGGNSPCGNFSDCGDGSSSSGGGDKKGQVYKRENTLSDWQEYTGNADIKINVWDGNDRSELDAGKIEGGIVKLQLPEIDAKYLSTMDEMWVQNSSCSFTSGAKVYITSDEGFNYYTETTSGFDLRLIDDDIDENAYEMVRYMYSLGAATMNCTYNINVGGGINENLNFNLSQGWNEIYMARSSSEIDGKIIRSTKWSTDISILTHLNDIKWRFGY
jgi:hypothetical protein